MVNQHVLRNTSFKIQNQFFIYDILQFKGNLPYRSGLVNHVQQDFSVPFYIQVTAQPDIIQVGVEYMPLFLSHGGNLFFQHIPAHA